MEAANERKTKCSSSARRVHANRMACEKAIANDHVFILSMVFSDSKALRCVVNLFATTIASVDLSPRALLFSLFFCCSSSPTLYAIMSISFGSNFAVRVLYGL